jgi:DNA helicase-2/ATP-dependent DNA helicase PcrA
MKFQLDTLSEEQRKVVIHTGGPLLVVAGAGSGKTRALTYRTAYLVWNGVPPESILVSTFTNRATREFKERLHGLLGDDAGRLRIGTLHATGARILRQYGSALGLDPRFPIYDARDSLKVVKRAAAELEISKDLIAPPVIMDAICRYKERLISPIQATYSADGDYEDLIAHTYERYQEILDTEGAVDFGDLIMKTVWLLEDYPDLAETLDFRHVLVDEFQDTDTAQFKMVRLLIGYEDGDNLTVVGDIDQAIYSFRGADHQIMCNFTQTFPNATVHSLGKNYRCSGMVVGAAAAVIVKNENRIIHDLTTDNPLGEPIIFMSVMNETDEAIALVRQIRAVQHVLKVPLDEIAVLYRTNIASLPIEHQLLNARIPYHVHGHRFFERREILDVMSYLRVINNPEDSAAWHDLLTKTKRKISDTAMKHIETVMRQTGQPLSELIRTTDSLPITAKQKIAITLLTGQIVILRSLVDKETLPGLIHKLLTIEGIIDHYQEKEGEGQKTRGVSAVDNLQRLVSLLSNSYPGIASEALPEFIGYASLMSDDESDGVEGVQLMTLHAAKGTEYQVVFLVGVEEDNLPHWRSKSAADATAAIEEERRLFYVGMTRAKQLLHLTQARTRRTLNNREVVCVPSRFLSEIPSTHLVRWKGMVC